jgi:outer membrane protein TolC
MRQILIILTLLCFSFGFSQNQPTTFSLDEAISYALENNRQSKNANRDIDAAKQQKKETTATGLPQINGSIDYQNFFKQQVQVIPSDFSDPNSELVPVIFGTTQNVNASATLSQLIFDGSYLVGLQSTKVFLEISRNAKVKTDLEVRKAVINAYGNVLLAEESVQILERNIEVLEKNLNEIKTIYENGLEEEESVEQLQITLTTVKSNLSNTKRLKDIAYQMLNINLGLELENPTELSDTLETLAILNIQLDLLEENTDVKNTIDYKIADNNKVSKELLVKLERSKALPTLSAFLTGGYNSFSNDFTFLNGDQDYFGYSIFGASLNIPIFSSGLRSAKTQRARIELEKAEDDLIETEQRIKLQVASAKSDFKFAIEDYDNKKKNLALAERIENKNQTKFFEGIASSFDLRQAQIQLYGAQQELLQAMLDVINSKAELETVLNSPINN